MPPLEGLLVVDFSTLLPGPLASLMLAEAGAEVVKIERPGRGDESRSYEPRVGEDSVNFHLLNRGKRSIALDLKAPGAIERLLPLLEKADVLIEQFRPGVMDRLGLGYASVRKMNPRVIYCSLTGWGQTGPKSGMAAHDLNYIAATGILALSAGADGAPVLPPVLAADIAAGSYPAVINILLALRQREHSGLGTHLDIAMCDGLFTLAYWGLGNGFAANAWPRAGRELLTGGSPRYQLYRAADGRYIAAAPLEDKFWNEFCHLIDLAEQWRAPDAPADEVIAQVAALIASRTSAQWQAVFADQDVCCSVMANLEEAMVDPHTVARRVFERQVTADGAVLPALPVPIAPEYRPAQSSASAPRLGESNASIEL